MLAIIGTVPEPDFPLIHGKVSLSEGHLIMGDRKITINRGTPALLAAAVKTSEIVNGPEIYSFLAGDTGKGEGSRKLYEFLERSLPNFTFCTLVFHYIQPIAEWHDRIHNVIETMESKPVLIADAGYMYVAKMCGRAGQYELFTPDIGELAFLADELAPHPFYTRGFILHDDDNAPNLIRRAYSHGNAAKYMVVKGKTDYIVKDGEILNTVDEPSHDAMEAIGGTGDTLTGLAAVLCTGPLGIEEGALAAAKINRWIGHYAKPDPSTQVSDLIEKIPQALSRVLEKNGEEAGNV